MLIIQISSSYLITTAIQYFLRDLFQFFFFRDSNYIIVDGKTLKVDNCLLETIFPGKLFQDCVSISGKAKGLTIAEV